MLGELIESLFSLLLEKLLGNRVWAWALFILLIIVICLIVIFV